VDIITRWKNNMKLLVTGGTGLVGSAIKDVDFRLNSADADLRRVDQCNNIFNEKKPTHVIHCAARVGGLGGNMNAKGEFYYDNIMMNTNVIEACRKYNVEKLICFLSTCVFPDDATYPLTEEMIHLGEPHSSNFGYAYAKRMADVQIRAYSEQYGLKYLSVIPCGVYGINDNFNIKNGHVIPSLIHKCHIAKHTNTDFEVWGSGRPLREFLYSKDIGKICNYLIENHSGTDPIILTSGLEYSIRDIVSLIVNAMEFKGNVKWLDDKPDGQYRKPASNKRLLSIMPDFEFTPIEVGIKETVDWFNKNYGEARL
jgi:GDP-L-fucose synthase